MEDRQSWVGEDFWGSENSENRKNTENNLQNLLFTNRYIVRNITGTTMTYITQRWIGAHLTITFASMFISSDQ